MMGVPGITVGKSGWTKPLCLAWEGTGGCPGAQWPRAFPVQCRGLSGLPLPEAGLLGFSVGLAEQSHTYFFCLFVFLTSLLEYNCFTMVC